MKTPQNTTTHHEKVVKFLSSKPREISVISQNVGLTEKQVRHAIGVARSRGFNIQRDSLRQFKNLGRAN